MAGSALSNEKRLIKNLLNNYENVGIVGRPVRNTSETITVYFGLALIQILDLDEKNQILNTNVWSRYVRTVVIIIIIIISIFNVAKITGLLLGPREYTVGDECI